MYGPVTGTEPNRMVRQKVRQRQRKANREGMVWNKASSVVPAFNPLKERRCVAAAQR